jgi:cysteine synthase A
LSGIHRSILEAIGRTPLIELQRVRPPDGRILVKMESLNPGGSVKCRPAHAMVRDAERQGLLRPDSIIVEASSGNQGIALCMVGAALGYRVRIVMPANMTRERQAIIRAYGAELVLTDPGNDIGEAIGNALAVVERMAGEDPRVFVPGQFANPANPQSHYQTTAQEILEQIGTEGQVDAFVSGIGTGGTLTGVGRALKEAYPGCLVVAAEPQKAAILSGGQIGHHLQQGIGDGIVPPVLDLTIVDRTVLVSDEAAMATASRLAREEGMMVGISSGTNVHAALMIARDLGAARTILTICPDTGDRYLSIGPVGEGTPERLDAAGNVGRHGPRGMGN